ncbi:hypothetical protein HK098_007582 [Nowakowskiella sp. JEL0407]|nr:hypothetical protein HK098_007582 [Nowakowskiella sp. JEL0407]
MLPSVSRASVSKSATKIIPLIASNSTILRRSFNSDNSDNVTKLTQADPTGSYASLIDILFREGHYTKGTDLLQQLQDHKAGVAATSGAHASVTDTEVKLETIINYNNSIISAVESGNVATAESVLEEMKSKLITPSCEAYNALARYYATKERNWKRVYELVGEMSHCGITKDLHLFNVVIRGFVNNLDMVSAIHSFNEMTNSAIRPNIVTFNTMIDGYTRKGWKAEAEEWFNKIKESNIKPNQNTYNMLIELFARSNDVSGALRYVKYMREAGLSPDSRTWTALLDAYTRASHWSYAFTVWEDHLRPSDLNLPSGGGLINTVSEAAVTAFLRLCAASGNVERATKEWNYLKESGNLVRPSAANCNALIECYLKNGLYVEAKKVLFDQMRRGDEIAEFGVGTKPVATWKTYVLLLQYLSKNNRSREIDEVKVVMFAHDHQVVEAVLEELPHLFSPEERTYKH